MQESNISPELLQSFSKSYKGAKVLITGGTRFLGKKLTAAFSKAGAQVTAVGSKECDFRDRKQVLKLVSQKFDLIIHCAAVQGGLEFILSHPTQIFLDNQMIHTNLLAACMEHPPRKLIGVGSSCSYPGNFSDMREEDFWNGRLEESVFTYGFTKKVLFVGQYSLFKEKKTPGAHVVLNNLYGPGDNFEPEHAHVIATLITKFQKGQKERSPVNIWGEGSAEREFLYVDDAVEGILRTVLKVEGFELLNIANGKPTKIRQLVEVLSKVFNYDRIIFDTSKPSGAKLKSLNPTKCRTLLGWIPSTELEGGIRSTVDWYQKTIAHKTEEIVS